MDDLEKWMKLLTGFTSEEQIEKRLKVLEALKLAGVASLKELEEMHKLKRKLVILNIEKNGLA